MKPGTLVVNMILVSALLHNWPAAATAAGASKEPLAQHGGKATDHMSERGSTNTNAQWSADPERGWVRADKRRELHEQNRTAKESNHQFDKEKRKRKTD